MVERMMAGQRQYNIPMKNPSNGGCSNGGALTSAGAAISTFFSIVRSDTVDAAAAARDERLDPLLETEHLLQWYPSIVSGAE